jgi:hypothetical protein
MQFSEKQIKNFWSKVSKTDSCWNWTGFKLGGYGKFNLNGKIYTAHKISLLLSGFNISPSKKELGSKGEIVMHTCDNPSCVNPKHLRIGTQKDNMRDAKIKGRKWCGEYSGENNNKHKLVWKDIDFIRNSNLNPVELAKQFSVSRSQIYGIINFKSWIPA